MSGSWGECRISVADGTTGTTGTTRTEVLADPLTDLPRVIAEAAGRGPLLVTADDVCRADGEALRALRGAVEESRRLPVVVAVSVQRGRPPREPTQLARLMDGMDQLVLEGLSEQETADLARGVLQRRVPPGYAAWCHRLTLGNPFMLTQLLRRAAATGLPAKEELAAQEKDAPVLPAVGEAVARCLDLVDPGLLPVATAIAVTGEHGPDALPLLARLTGTPLAQTLAAADQLVRLGFITDDGTVALRHPLAASALAGGLTAMARSAIHLGAATYLHERRAAPQRTARHLVDSGIRFDDTWPTSVLLEAARGAARSGDHDTALSFTEHALRTADGDQYPQAVLLACDVRFLTDWEGGMDLALASLRELRDEGDRVQLLDRLDRALHGPRPDPATADRALAAVRTALAGSALASWDRLYGVISQFGFVDVSVTADQLAGIDAVSRADEPAATAIVRVADVFRAACAQLAAPGDETAVRQARSVLDAYEEMSSTHLVGVPAALVVLAQSGWYDEAAERARRLERGGEPLQPDGFAPMADAVIALCQGRTDKARASLEHVLRALPPVDTRPVVPMRIIAVGLLAELYAERGEDERAWKLLRQYRYDGELGPGWVYLNILLARAGLRCDAGDLTGAARDLKELLLRVRAGGAHPGTVPAWRRHGVTRLSQCGLLEEARDAAAEQLRVAERTGLPLELGRALRARARVEEGPHAAGLLREAVELLRGDPAGALDLAHAQADRGLLFLRLGESEQAVAALVEAVGLARECGAQPLVRQSTALLAVCDRHSAPHAPLRRVTTLTERERQIFLMATRGTSNRRIAETLEITRRTVELHLSSAYRKLDITGRQDFPELLSVPGVGPMLEAGPDSACPDGHPRQPRHRMLLEAAPAAVR